MSSSTNHEHWIRRCLELAQKGHGWAAPNPLVGSVIVHNNIAIGEGFHQKYGEAHAEVNAINSMSHPELIPESTLYVNLEPCSHHGKTPPCSDLIIQKGFKKVVIGSVDSNHLVSGKGISKLQNSGIEVIQGILTEECRAINQRFFTFNEKKRPYYTLKWAETKDGFIYSDHHPPAISNKQSQQLVHEIRAKEQAILIGKNTLMTDNPSLNVRLADGKNPIRIVIANKLDEAIFNQKIFQDGQPTLLFNVEKNENIDNVELIKYDPNQFIDQLNKALHQRNISSVLVEGGEFTFSKFIESNYWDKAIQITGNKLFTNGKKAPVISKTSKLISEKNVGEDNWKTYINQ